MKFICTFCAVLAPVSVHHQSIRDKRCDLLRDIFYKSGPVVYILSTGYARKLLAERININPISDRENCCVFKKIPIQFERGFLYLFPLLRKAIYITSRLSISNLISVISKSFVSVHSIFS